KDRRILALLSAGAIAAGGAWLPAARAYAENWAADSAGPDYRAAVAAGHLAGILAVERGCRLHLLGTADFAPRFVRYADAAMKAQVPRAAGLLDCIVTGEHSPWFSITNEKPCLDAHWLPLVPARIGAGIHGARGVGNLCYHYFADPPPREQWNDPASRWFQYDGAAFREISAAPPSPFAPPSPPSPPSSAAPLAPLAPPATGEISDPLK
ncbi:MAG: hypothetical protein ABJB04_02745, partial [Betaproteobacteria bacterium]